MTCNEWRVFLQDYVDGVLSEPATKTIDRHLSECAACLGEARAHKALVARLAGQPLVEPPAGLAAGVLKKLEPVGSWKREFARLAAAAALLVGLGGVVYAGFSSKVPKIEGPSIKAPLEEAGHQIERIIQKAGY